jgi:quinohemoprotein ethanol dehydrogenase
VSESTMSTRRAGYWLIALFGVTALAQQAHRVDQNALKRAASQPNEWLTYGRDYAETHYSPLKEINDQNVSRLGLAWSWETGTTATFEGTPLIADGVIYGTGSWSVVFAVDARTGKEKWRYDPDVDRSFGSHACCGPNNRGVAIYDGKVFVGVLDGRLAALDQETGKKLWSVKTTEDDYQSITGAPRVVKGKVIIGNAGAEYGVRGYVSAYDAKTGKLDWRFYTIPGDPSKPVENPALTKALETWHGEWWKTGGGGTVWDALAYDPEPDLLYVGTGNGGPWSREVRSPGGGDNLYLSSILALKPETGKLVWYYQTTPGDSWDFTATQNLILADMPIGGRQRKVIVQAPKNGFFYVLDRITGELLSAKPFTDINWATSVDMTTGKPVETPGARYIDAPFLIWAGAGGAHSWQPMSYSPDTRLVYIPGTNAAFPFAPDPNYKWQRGKQNFAATFNAPPDAPQPPKPSGFLVAWDPATNSERWRVKYPARPGGTAVTAGNLVFESSPDGHFLAYSAGKGDKLWDVQVGGGMATPVTYLLDGKQYVAVLAGRNGGRLLVFALDGKEPIPALPAPPARGGRAGAGR